MTRHLQLLGRLLLEQQLLVCERRSFGLLSVQCWAVDWGRCCSHLCRKSADCDASAVTSQNSGPVQVEVCSMQVETGISTYRDSPQLISLHYGVLLTAAGSPFCTSQHLAS